MDYNAKRYKMEITKTKNMFEIEFKPDGEYDFKSVSEVCCRLLCEMTDLGPRWSESSRYSFTYKNYSKNKSDFRFGTAKACIQSWLLENKFEHMNFNINAITKNGTVLKTRTLTE